MNEYKGKIALLEELKKKMQSGKRKKGEEEVI